MFSRLGIVDDVFAAWIPDTNAHAQKVTVTVDRSDLQPEGAAPRLAPVQPQVAFFIAADLALRRAAC